MNFTHPLIPDQIHSGEAFSVIYSTQPAKWDEVLRQVSRYDYYHLLDYHKIAEKRGEGKAVLFAFQKDPYFIALPLLLRKLGDEEWVHPDDRNLSDATSVYGYCGPISSHDSIPDSFRDKFQQSLFHHLNELKVVSVFSRLHPIISQEELLKGMGTQQIMGETVSIDLHFSAEEVFQNFIHGHQQSILKLRKQGFQTVHDSQLEHLEAFTKIYHANMKRVGASPNYFFDLDYFRNLTKQSVDLLVVLKDGELAGGSLILRAGSILQYHLSATADNFVSKSPLKLLIDDVSRWGRDQGYRWFHMGGGLGGKKNSLFDFKAGFANIHHEFRIWQWVVDPEGYQRLCRQREEWSRNTGRQNPDVNFFPAYRAPI